MIDGRDTPQRRVSTDVLNFKALVEAQEFLDVNSRFVRWHGMSESVALLEDGD